ncbi:hypothetical protein OQ704_09530, partial [Mycobacterium ulcerans]|nr:hypothetical protein [Mycobacterium ulcerans]MEB3976954.1 hypothetical protein [Mycobacterium ulcerans]MEB4006303.1 hypothetical protein [Mycobacterium ulcerans]MEB4415814.1 hypothetical protein [Mycobacterium ulcerans]MEB4434091.1 hypothetical protein [Mycobacterium ulcerans]
APIARHQRSSTQLTSLLINNAGALGSALLFPSLCRSTGGLPAAEVDPPSDYCDQRSAMMPRRQRTRAQDRARRVATERRQNHHARSTQPGGQARSAAPPTPPQPEPQSHPLPF